MLTRRLRYWIGSARRRAALREEMELHIAEAAAELRRKGLGESDARSEARRRFGSVLRNSEDAHAVWAVVWLEQLLQDVRFGLRQLTKTPAITIAVILSLTIGIGANTSMFSLIDAAILRPLPVTDPDELVILEWVADDIPEGVSGVQGDLTELGGGRTQASSVSPSLYRSLAEEQTGFDSVMGAGGASLMTVSADLMAVQVQGVYVSPNFFSGLGVPPMLGRGFLDEDDIVGREPSVIVSERFWRSRLGFDPEVLRRTISINDTPARIVGVAPRGFFGLTVGQWTDIYVPIAMHGTLEPDTSSSSRADANSLWWVRLLARLDSDRSPSIAAAQMSELFRNVTAETTGTERDESLELRVTPGQRGFDAIEETDSRALWTLMLLVALLLLLVCANVANLFLCRSVARQRESAIRLALGSTHGRLIRQYLLESAIVALLSGGIALFFGYGLALSIHSLFQAGQEVSSAFAVQVDWQFALFTAAVSVLAAFLFGLAPAFRAARAHLSQALRTQSRSVTGGHMRLPRVLVSLQFSLCVAVLTAAGLLVQTLQNLNASDLGFEADNLSYVTVDPLRSGYSGVDLENYMERLQQEMATIPGVLNAVPMAQRMLQGGGNFSLISTPDGPPARLDNGRPNWSTLIVRSIVGTGALETLQIPLLAGRLLDRQDDLSSGVRAAVVDERFAQRFFPDQTPIGLEFAINNGQQRFMIVGLVGNARFLGMRGDTLPIMYYPLEPSDIIGPVHFAVRSTLDTASLSVALRQAVTTIDSGVPVTEFYTQEGLIDRLLRSERLLAILSGTFAATALLLAAVGLWGMLAYAVARRTVEIGVRVALGATTWDISSMVVRSSLLIVGGGMLIGLPAAFALAKVIESTLFGLNAVDPLTVLLTLLTLTIVALFAAWVPARRAARISPVTALGEESM